MKQRLFRVHRRALKLTPRIIVIREKVSECQINPTTAVCTSSVSIHPHDEYYFRCITICTFIGATIR
jgi:hypothetical protein